MTLGLAVWASSSSANPNVETPSDPYLEAVLQEIVAHFEPFLPKLYQDGTTTLLRVEADAHRFSYFYELDTDWTGPLRDSDILSTTLGNCDPAGGVWPIIKRGAHVRHSYINRDGHFIGSFTVKPSDCDQSLYF